MKKSITRNYLYNISYQILILILPLLTAPYLSRVLGPDGVGSYGYTNSITQYFVLFGCIGLNLYGQREIAYRQDDFESRSIVFWELLFTRVISISVCIIIFLFTVCKSAKYGTLFTMEIFELVAAAIDVSWFFQGLEEFKKIVIRNAIVKIIGLACIFVFVKTTDHVIRYALIYSGTLLLGNISIWIYMPRYVRRVDVKKLSLIRHLRPAFILFIPQIATNIYNLLDKSMIGLLTNNDAEVAYYEQAQKIIKIALAIPTSLGTVMLPRIASLFSKNKNDEVHEHIYKSMCVMSMLAIPISFGLVGIARDFVPWFYGAGYEKVVPNIMIIAPIVILIGFSNVMGVQYLLPTGRQKEYTRSVFLGTILNLGFNATLIPFLFSSGAAIGSVIAETGVTLLQAFFLRKTFKFSLIIKAIWKYFLASGIMLIIICIISLLFQSHTILITIIEILFGGIIYLIVLLVLKDKLMIEIFNKLRKRN